MLGKRVGGARRWGTGSGTYLKGRGSWKEKRDAPKQQEEMDSSISQAQGATREEIACTPPTVQRCGAQCLQPGECWGRREREWRWGNWKGYKGQDGDQGGAGSLRLGPHTSSPTLQGPARPPPAEVFPNLRGAQVCFSLARRKMHSAGPAGSHCWSLCP